MFQCTNRMRWPKYWSFSFSIIPSKEIPRLISFRMHWLDLLAVQGTLKSLLQHHSSRASILQRSAFFTVQLSHPYMTTGKTIALTRRTFVGKVMSLLFNMLSRLVRTFLPRSKLLLVSWLQSPPTVILEPKKIKSATVSPSICHEVIGLRQWQSQAALDLSGMCQWISKCGHQYGNISIVWGHIRYANPLAPPKRELVNQKFWRRSLAIYSLMSPEGDSKTAEV